MCHYCGCREMPLIRAFVAEAHPGEAMIPDSATVGQVAG